MEDPNPAKKIQGMMNTYDDDISLFNLIFNISIQNYTYNVGGYMPFKVKFFRHLEPLTTSVV